MSIDLLQTRELQNVTYERIFDYLNSINAETQRLEFKRELQPLVVAKEAVAMANAIGGVIVIGFQDPPGWHRAYALWCAVRNR
jgi:hypothetical protein